MITYAIIPARMAATRFPGKPLAPMDGIPMLGHVALRTALATSLTATYVATCDVEIADYCHSQNIKVVMTSAEHTRCTDRCAEALPLIEQLEGKKADAIVIVQGDEPLVHPDMIDAALTPLHQEPTAQVVNLRAAITSQEEFLSPNTIKVVTDGQGRALYFSRSTIPSTNHGVTTNNILGHKQVCIMPFRRQALLDFIALDQTPLEQAESIDMLRLLENGIPVHTVLTSHINQSVDCPEDLQRATQLLKNDPLWKKTYF